MTNVSKDSDKLIVKTKKLLDSKDLTIEDKLRYNALLDVIRAMTPDVRIKWCDYIRDDLQSYKTYNVMDEIANDIDDFLKNNPGSEDITKRIMELPQYRLMHFMSDDFIKKCENYTNKVYDFVLYKSFIGETALLSRPDIREIVNTKAHIAVDELKESIVLPEPLNTIINELEKNPSPYTSPYKYSNPELLKQLYAHKNGLILIPSAELSKRIEIARGEVVASKKNLRKSRRKSIALGTAYAAGFIGLAALIWHITKKINMQPKYFNQTGIIYDTNMNEVDSFRSSPDEWTIAPTLSISDLNTEKKYITELSDTIDGVTHVKVYDYTGVDLDKEQLETVVLDESRLIIDEDTKDKFFRNNYYGVKTSEAHRNISIVKYEFDKLSQELDFVLFMLLPTLIYIGLTLSIHLEGGLDSIWEEYKNNKKLSNESIEKLDKLLLEYKRVLKQQETNNINAEEVEKELEDNRPVGFRI